MQEGVHEQSRARQALPTFLGRERSMAGSINIPSSARHTHTQRIRTLTLARPFASASCSERDSERSALVLLLR
jgi:hypothetical protein